METIEKIIEVNAPLSTVYNQWTQFESFPEFMEGVVEVKQLDDKRLHWKANIGGSITEWDAEIIQQTPDSMIAWRSVSGPVHTGTVSFRTRGANRTEVMVRIEIRPQSMLESIAGSFGVVDRRVEADLKRFKDFVEDRTAENGTWRGRIMGERIEQQTEPRSKRLREA